MTYECKCGNSDCVYCLGQLIRDAYPVMKSHESRHARKAANDRMSGFWRESHQNRAAASANWLERAKEFCSEMEREVSK